MSQASMERHAGISSGAYSGWGLSPRQSFTGAERPHPIILTGKSCLKNLRLWYGHRRSRTKELAAMLARSVLAVGGAHRIQRHGSHALAAEPAALPKEICRKDGAAGAHPGRLIPHGRSSRRP